MKVWVSWTTGLLVALMLAGCLTARASASMTAFYMSPRITEAFHGESVDTQRGWLKNFRLADRCSRSLFVPFIAARTLDAITTQRIYKPGREEGDPLLRPFSGRLHKNGIDVAIGMAFIDTVAFFMTRHSSALRCAYEVHAMVLSAHDSFQNMHTPAWKKP